MKTCPLFYVAGSSEGNVRTEATRRIRLDAGRRVVVLSSLDSEFKGPFFLVVGVGPVALVWGVAWVVAGFRSNSAGSRSPTMTARSSLTPRTASHG